MNTSALSNSKQIRIRNMILFGISAGLFIYVFLRAYLLSLTTDENGTFTMFLQKGIIIPEKYDVYAANDHILNTALMTGSTKIFGIGELALRLPNVLFYILFLWSTAKIAARFNSLLFSVGAFMLLNFHPYLIEYFSLARGYGIAMACSAAAIHFLWKYYEEGKMKQMLWVNFFCALMIFANFMFMNLYLPIIGSLFLMTVLNKKIQPGKIRLVHVGVMIVFASLVLFEAMNIILNMKEANALFAGAKDFFWMANVHTLFTAELMDAPYTSHLIDGIVLTVEVLLVCSSIIIVFFTIRDRAGKERDIFPLVALGILLLSGLSVFIQHQLLGTPYPALRMALFYLFPFFLVVTLALNMIPVSKKFTAVSIFVLSLLFVIHFLRTSSMYHSFGWNYAEDNRTVADYLTTEHGMHPQERTRLAYNDQFDILGFDYYKIKNKMTWLDLVADSSYIGDPLNDFVYISPDRRKFIPDSLWKAVQTFPSGNMVMQPLHAFHKINKDENFGVNVLGKKDPGELIISATHKTAGLIGQFRDTIPEAERFVFNGTIDVKCSAASNSVLYLVIEHDHKQYYSKNWDLRLLCTKQDEMETIHVTASIPEQLQDGDWISFYVGYIDGAPIEANNIGIDLTAFAN